MFVGTSGTEFLVKLILLGIGGEVQNIVETINYDVSYLAIVPSRYVSQPLPDEFRDFKLKVDFRGFHKTISFHPPHPGRSESQKRKGRAYFVLFVSHQFGGFIRRFESLIFPQEGCFPEITVCSTATGAMFKTIWLDMAF